MGGGKGGERGGNEAFQPDPKTYLLFPLALALLKRKGREGERKREELIEKGKKKGKEEGRRSRQ